MLNQKSKHLVNVLGISSRCLSIGLFLYSSALIAESKEDRFQQLFDGKLTILDLTYSLSENSIYWPSADGNPFKYEVTLPHADGSAQMGKYSTPEHHGTHLDAPSHGKQGLASVDELTAKDLFGPAIVIDISEQASKNSDYMLTIVDLVNWETQFQSIPHGAIVLLYTGWSLRSEDPQAYVNQDKKGVLHFPGFSPESATWLISQREIRGIGIDNMSVDKGESNNYPVHDIVNGAGKFHLENVANMHLLPTVGANLIVAPTKIQDGSGGHVRIYAILP